MFRCAAESVRTPSTRCGGSTKKKRRATGAAEHGDEISPASMRLTEEFGKVMGVELCKAASGLKFSWQTRIESLLHKTSDPRMIKMLNDALAHPPVSLSNLCCTRREISSIVYFMEQLGLTGDAYEKRWVVFVLCCSSIDTRVLDEALQGAGEIKRRARPFLESLFTTDFHVMPHPDHPVVNLRFVRDSDDGPPTYRVSPVPD